MEGGTAVHSAYKATGPSRLCCGCDIACLGRQRPELPSRLCPLTQLSAAAQMHAMFSTDCSCMCVRFERLPDTKPTQALLSCLVLPFELLHTAAVVAIGATDAAVLQLLMLVASRSHSSELVAVVAASASALASSASAALLCERICSDGSSLGMSNLW